MNHLFFITSLIIWSTLYVVTSQGGIVPPLPCNPGSCAAISCLAIGNCPKGEVVIMGGWCNCCPGCAKVIGLNEYCGPDVEKPVVCKKGLKCVDNRCQKNCY